MADRPVTGSRPSFRSTMETRPTPPAVGSWVTFIDGRSELGLSVTSTFMGSRSLPRCPETVATTGPRLAVGSGALGVTVTSTSPNDCSGWMGCVVVTVHDTCRP